MRKRLINNLDYKERQWFYKAVIQMIIADKNIAPEEVDDLKDTLKMIAGKELKDFKDIVTSPDFSIPLRPLRNIDFESAFVIIMELARIAAIDARFVLEEKELLKEYFSLLEFDEDSLKKIMAWTERLALLNKEEETLKEELKSSFKE